MPGPGVRADDRAERRRDLDLGVRPHVLDELPQRRQALGRRSVRDPDLEVRRVGRGRLEQRPELGERLRVAAHALERDHLTVADREDRLHVQEVPGERRRAADAAAAREVLERVDGEEQLVLALVVARRTRRSPRRSCRARAGAARRSRASRSPPRRCASRSRAPRRRRAARRRPGRSRTCRRASRRSGSRGSARSGRRELLERGEEVAGRRLRRRRQLGVGLQPLVEAVGRDVDVVAEALVAEAHVQRHDPEVREARRASGKSAVESSTIAVLSAVSFTRRQPRTRSPRSGRSPRPSSRRPPPRPAPPRRSPRRSPRRVRQTTRVVGSASSTSRVASAPFRPGIR